MRANRGAVLAIVIALSGTAGARAAADGKGLYEAKCGMCHGMNGAAKSMAAGSGNFNDSAWRKTQSSELIAKVIHDGKGKMKGLGDRLTADQAKAIADYVLTLAK